MFETKQVHGLRPLGGEGLGASITFQYITMQSRADRSDGKYVARWHQLQGSRGTQWRIT